MQMAQTTRAFPELSNGGFGLKSRGMVIGVKIVRLFHKKMVLSLPEMLRFSIRSHPCKAQNKLCQIPKVWGELGKKLDKNKNGAGSPAPSLGEPQILYIFFLKNQAYIIWIF